MADCIVIDIIDSTIASFIRSIQINGKEEEL